MGGFGGFGGGAGGGGGMPPMLGNMGGGMMSGGGKPKNPHYATPPVSPMHLGMHLGEDVPQTDVMEQVRNAKGGGGVPGMSMTPEMMQMLGTNFSAALKGAK